MQILYEWLSSVLCYALVMSNINKHDREKTPMNTCISYDDFIIYPWFVCFYPMLTWFCQSLQGQQGANQTIYLIQIKEEEKHHILI